MISIIGKITLSMKFFKLSELVMLLLKKPYPNVLGHVYTETKTNLSRYQKSLPFTRNRLKKRVRPHETARSAGDAVVHMPSL